MAEHEEFLSKLDESLLLFDQMFYTIAPIHKYNNFAQSKRIIPILSKDITDQQCEMVKKLSGLLTNVKLSSDKFRIRSPEYQELASVNVSWDQHINKTTNKNVNTAALLKEYLTLELCRSEELEFQLKEREEALVTMTAAHEKLRKRLINIENASVKSEVKDVQYSKAGALAAIDVSESGDPNMFVGCFIRKEFSGKHYFGLVTTYDLDENEKHQFMIVYEDSDYEEIDLKELKKLLWNNLVPIAKSAACKKHFGELVKQRKIPATSKSSSISETNSAATHNTAVNSAANIVSQSSVGSQNSGPSSSSLNSASVSVGAKPTSETAGSSAVKRDRPVRVLGEQRVDMSFVLMGIEEFSHAPNMAAVREVSSSTAGSSSSFVSELEGSVFTSSSDGADLSSTSANHHIVSSESLQQMQLVSEEDTQASQGSAAMVVSRPEETVSTGSSSISRQVANLLPIATAVSPTTQQQIDSSSGNRSNNSDNNSNSSVAGSVNTIRPVSSDKLKRKLDHVTQSSPLTSANLSRVAAGSQSEQQQGVKKRFVEEIADDDSDVVYIGDKKN